MRLEVWRKTWRVGKRGNHGNQDKPVASPHTPPVSVDVLPSADIQSTSTTANAETSPIVHVDTSNEHVELAEVPLPMCINKSAFAPQMPSFHTLTLPATENHPTLDLPLLNLSPRHCQSQMKQTWIFWTLLVVYRNGCVCDVVVRKLCHSNLSHVQNVK